MATHRLTSILMDSLMHDNRVVNFTSGKNLKMTLLQYYLSLLPVSQCYEVFFFPRTLVIFTALTIVILWTRKQDQDFSAYFIIKNIMASNTSL